MRLEVHSEARAEFLQAVSFYEAQVPGLGLRFITEMGSSRGCFWIKQLRLAATHSRVAQLGR